jgi:peroxiredoxin
MMGQKISTRTIIDSAGIGWVEMDMMGAKQVMKMDMDAMMEMSNDMMGGAFSGMMGGGAPQDPRNMIGQMNTMYALSNAGTQDLDGTEVYVIGGNIRPEVHEQMDAAADGADTGVDGFDASSMLGMMDSVRLYVATADGFPRKMEMLGADGTPWMTQTYRNVVLNAPMDDSEFAYTPADGVSVTDMNEMMEAGLDAGGGPDDSEYNSKMKIGDLAPDFEGPALGGGTLMLSDYKGKVVLLDFWATWCGPCVAEVPNVIETYEELHAKGLEIVGISLDDDRASLDSFLAGHPGMSWKQVFDGQAWESPIADLYGVDAIPFTLLIDKEGKIAARDLRGGDLKAEISKLLGDE